ncbi:MAG: serine--tRNA ligase [Candidatus Levybacteria bacterium]|nr:serine--tRNA ligase [Candidatus Levybacteria bacterium]
MIDIKFLRENPDKVQKAAKDKGFDVDIAHLLEIDAKKKELTFSVQRIREERNRFAREKNIEEGKRLKDRLEKEEHALKAVEEELDEWLSKVPNPAKPDVKVGEDESENEIIKTWGKPKKFDFTPKDHLELGEILDIIDVKRAAKVSGARFYYLKNKGALLEFALINLVFEILLKEGFTPVIPPVLIKKEVMKGLGYTEYGTDEDIFYIEKDELFLVGTAEHAIVPMHKDELFNQKDLPKRYVGFSTCFRREAGSYGKDTRGILRVHQFDKVEMVSFVKEGEDDKEQEYLLSLEEKLFQMLDIPYRVVKMCTGDLGFPAARKYDIEAWIPTQNKYREVTSVSTVTDFQSRRLNIRYQEGQEKKYAYVLNGTAFAMPRTIIAILENYQDQDGSITVPEVLRKYIGSSSIKPQK